MSNILADETKFQAMCKAAFEEIDKDKSGSVDTKELEQCLKNMASKNGLPAPSKQDIQDALKLFDKNKDGTIQFNEFVEVTRDSCKKAQAKNLSGGKDTKIILDEKIYLTYATAAFEAIDKDKNGTINVAELTKAFEAFGFEAKLKQPASAQAQKLIEKYDTNKDKKIEFSEFRNMASELYNIDIVGGQKGGKTAGEEHKSDSHVEIPPEVDEATKQRVQMGEEYIQYIEETGLAMAFKIIFAEILSKKIPEDAAFAYTATRLRQIGEDIAYIQNSKYKKAPKKY
jgi:Ca2+-binding EF-hand superfamily protein